jgi:LEA14-like dessication related protein
MLPAMRQQNRPHAAGSEPDPRRSSSAPRRSACLLAALAATSATGCITPHQTPRFTLLAATATESTDQATVVEFDIAGINANDFALPLRQVSYTLTIDGTAVFTGTREARVTLPRLGEQTFTLPAAITDEQRRALFGPACIAAPAPATLNAAITYETPGSIAEVLFDANLRRPAANVTLTTTLDLAVDAAQGRANDATDANDADQSSD